jgi:hypothetical protein
MLSCTVAVSSLIALICIAGVASGGLLDGSVGAT